MRETLIASKAYRDIQKQIGILLLKQEELFDSIPDTRCEYEMNKKALIKYMEEQGLTQAGPFIAKSRIKRTVDVRRVLETMGGDIDNLMLVASVSQKSLEEFYEANPEFKEEGESYIRDIK